ncbi:uncharacterized protein METZ01_LOCUS247511, partial [marine metagenome]
MSPEERRLTTNIPTDIASNLFNSNFI